MEPTCSAAMRRDPSPAAHDECAERSTWVRPGTLLALYAGRLRRQWLQELLAGAGIATGVALVFAVLAANTSIRSSAQEIVNGDLWTCGTAARRDRRERI